MAPSGAKCNRFRNYHGIGVVAALPDAPGLCVRTTTASTAITMRQRPDQADY